MASKMAPRGHPRRPRGPQESPESAPRGPQESPRVCFAGYCRVVLQGIAGVFAGVFAGSLQGIAGSALQGIAGYCRVDLQGIAGGSRGEGEGFMRSSKKELLRQLTTRDGPILTPSSCPSSASSPVLLPFQKVTDVLSLSRCMLLHFPDQSNSPEHRLCNCNAALARHSWTPNVDTCVTGRTSEQ